MNPERERDAKINGKSKDRKKKEAINKEREAESEERQ